MTWHMTNSIRFGVNGYGTSSHKLYIQHDMAIRVEICTTTLCLPCILNCVENDMLDGWAVTTSIQNRTKIMSILYKERHVPIHSHVEPISLWLNYCQSQPQSATQGTWLFKLLNGWWLLYRVDAQATRIKSMCVGILL